MGCTAHVAGKLIIDIAATENMVLYLPILQNPVPLGGESGFYWTA